MNGDKGDMGPAEAGRIQLPLSRVDIGNGKTNDVKE